MKHWLKVFTLLCLSFLFLIACSSNSGNKQAGVSRDSATMEQASTENKASMKDAADSPAEYAEADSTDFESSAKVATNIPAGQARMVIYHANLQIEVKDLKTVQSNISKLTNDIGGYIIEQNVFSYGDERYEGSIVARIPQKNFNAFLKKIEDYSIKVEQRTLTGQDVTEEYVDLESRLKSQQLVEKRLTQFMNDAKDTKNLLEISKELARVQEEIEAIKGRMKYLENQTSLSTVTIHLTENKVVVPNLENKDLNTWEKTKKQFMVSMNGIVSFFSALVIFTVGNIPIIIIIGIIVFSGLFLRKFIKKMKDSN